MQNKQNVIHDLSQNPSISYHLIKQIKYNNILHIFSLKKLLELFLVFGQNIEELANSMCKAV